MNSVNSVNSVNASNAREREAKVKAWKGVENVKLPADTAQNFDTANLRTARLFLNDNGIEPNDFRKVWASRVISRLTQPPSSKQYDEQKHPLPGE